MKTVKKQILRYGEWVNPNDERKKLVIDKTFVDRIVENFKKSPFAPIFRGHASRKAAEENPSLIVNKNIKSLEIDNEGLNAVMEIEDEDLKKYNDVSCGIAPEGRDNQTGNTIGPVLKHIALTLDPYIKNLNPFVALNDTDNSDLLINLSEINSMTEEKIGLEESVEATTVEEEKSPESVDVKTEESATEESTPVDGAEAESTDDSKIGETVEETPVTESEETEETEVDEANEAPDKLEEKTELSEVELLKARILELEEKDAKQSKQIALQEAEAQYKELLLSGKIVPAMKNAFINLSMVGDAEIELSDGSVSVKSMLTELFDKAPKLIQFEEEGVDVESEADPKEAKLKAVLRERKVEMSDEQFEEWFEKNRATILSAEK